MEINDVYEDSEDARNRREHVRVILLGAAITAVLLALIGWGAVGCSNYKETHIKCIERGDMLFNGNCIPS